MSTPQGRLDDIIRPRVSDVCGKQCYDKKGALTVKNDRERRGAANLRIYECQVCNAWHLTSQEKRSR